MVRKERALPLHMGSVSFQGGYLLLVKGVLWVEIGARVEVMALASLVGSSACADVKLILKSKSALESS